jgi:uncharacterized protein (DUF1800 family)
MVKRLLLVVCACLMIFSALAQSVETFGLGNTRNVNVTASSNASKGINTLLVDGYLPNYNAASRFLSQATLGTTFPDIQLVANQGLEKWVDDQQNLANSFGIESYLRYLALGVADSLNLANPPPATLYTVENLNLSDWYFDIAWFQGSMTAPDKLRWRVALALSEIFVTSRESAFDGNPYALASYYDLLLDQSFGNYRALLDSITYHPTMAVYLTFMNNHAQGIVSGNLVFPDENYAREIMQLFSIGLFELNQDGTEKKDVEGNSIPTYDYNDIAGLAKVFTGLSWQDALYIGDGENSEQDYTKRLKFFPYDTRRSTVIDAHQAGGKTFLGTTIGQGRTVEEGELDIQDALDVIYNHPNVGPFISRRLIQRLITSNPSKEYIGRVSAIFNDNGSGVRGDLGAVVKAILLDPEARLIPEKPESFAGKLREPFITYMNLVHGLGLTSSVDVFRNRMDEVYNQMEQRPMESPSVFNFFQPDYIPDGELKEAGKYGPEFQKLNSITLTGYLNSLSEWLIDNDPIDYASYFSGETYKSELEPRFDFTADYGLTSDMNVPVLLDKYNLILAHGALDKPSLDEIAYVIRHMPFTYSNGLPRESDQLFRIRMALYLIMASPDYLINR